MAGTGLLQNLVQQGGVYLQNPAREAATSGWQLWIKSATGEEANVRRTDDMNYIEWKPGQAEKFSQYFNDLLFKSKPKDEPEQRGMGFGEVSIDWKPVYKPLLIKKVLPIVAAYTVLAFMLGRMTKRK